MNRVLAMICPKARGTKGPRGNHAGGRLPNRAALEETVAWEQVKQAYAVAPIGILATVVNSLIVLVIMKHVIPREVLAWWIAAVFFVTLIRIALVLLFNRRADQSSSAAWARLFLGGLGLIGIVWGSIGLMPLNGLALARGVFLAFVLGGMSAGAAASFSVLKHGFPAFAIPALAPITIRFFLINDMFHHAMAAMLALYGFLLWKISLRHFEDNRSSLLLRFENEGMVDRLRRAKKSLEKLSRTLLEEVDAKRTAEESLRTHQEQLERTVEERTSALTQANQQLKAQIDERTRVEQELRDSRERLALAQKAGRVGVFDIDLATGKAFWTEELEELFGLPPGGFEGDFKAWARRVHADDRRAIDEQLRRWMRERRGHVEFEYRAVRADGQIRWMAATGEVSYRGDGKAARMIGTTVDSTERKKLQEEIMHMVHHDTLTGLPNRRLFMDIITLEMAQARRNRRKFALLFLDLDRFKEINDTLGHSAGDELLKEVSRRITGSIRQSDAAARIGGDEFNMILADIIRTDDVTGIVQKIMQAFEAPFVVIGYELRVTASIGISVYPDDSREISTLFRCADIAMYHAKELGGNRFQFYNRDINRQSTDRIRFQNYLRQTLARGELVVHYLPQRSVRTGRLVAAEALVRWVHPRLGLLEPKEFVPLAETIGLITAIDEWVLKTACRQFKAWIDQGGAPLCVTVNCSSRMFQDRDFGKKVENILDESGLPPDRLELEITESVAMTDIERSRVQLRDLARRGVGVSIDDFGTGLSSFPSFKRLPIHRIKIDRSIIRDMTTDPDDREIIKAMTAMAHAMKLAVVAEGVETREQMSFLDEAECDEAQGYLINQPLPPEQFSQLIAFR